MVTAPRATTRTVTASPEGALAQNARYFLAYTSYKQELLQDALVQCDEFLQIATREETRRKMATDYDVLDEAMQLKVRILRDQGREARQRWTASWWETWCG